MRQRRVHFGQGNRWLVKGGALVDLQNPDWDSAVHLLPSVSETASIRFGREGKWLLNGSWLIDLTSPSPAESALRLGIDDRTNVITFSPDGRWLFATSPAKIQLWDLQAEKINESMREADGPGGGGYGFSPANAANVAFSPDSRWATVTSYAGDVLIFDLTAKNLKPCAIVENQHSYMSLTWSDDSRWLTSGNSDGLKITDLEMKNAGNNATRSMVEVGSSGVRGIGPVRVSPDRRWLCFTRHRRFNSSNPPIKLWDLEAKDPLVSEIELPVPLGHIGDFSSDSRLLAIRSLRSAGSGAEPAVTRRSHSI